MPLYRLSRKLAFPDPERSLTDGLLAVGGDLSVERLLLAYSKGIFPWYNEGDPILWWSPDPRLILLPEEFYIGKRLARVNRTTGFRVTMDEAFPLVIGECAAMARPGQDGTWITRDMTEAYIRLHDAGFAHSVETWDDGELAGGVYGVSLGRCFFGESMFAKRSDASKIAFVRLMEQLKRWGFTLIDCQVHTEHLSHFGARDVPRREFLKRLSRSMEAPTRSGRWRFDAE